MEQFLVVWVFIGIFIYFIPVVIAGFRNHQNQNSIFFLNLLLGWTFIGWVACLVWSFTNPNKQVTQIVNNQSTAKDSSIDKLERLVKLKEQGVLTNEEFSRQKEKILNE